MGATPGSEKTQWEIDRESGHGAVEWGLLFKARLVHNLI